MRVGICCVGDELLDGTVVNGNAAWLGRELTAAGLRVTRQSVVGDDVADIAAAVSRLAGASDAVVVTGGLGPTPDDLTLDATRAAAGAGSLTELDNPVGTAPGARLEVAGTPVYVLPGVPVEMEVMARRHVLPDLLTRAGSAEVAAAGLRLARVGESMVARRLAGLGPAGDAVRVGYLCGPAEVVVRFSARGAGASARVDACLRRARELLGDAVVGADTDSLPAAVVRLLSERAATLATAESLTGGLLGAAVTDVPGASAVYLGGLTAYSTDLKVTELGVDAGLLAAEGPVHPEVAKQMAYGMRERWGSAFGLATTGVAGPDPQGGRRVGTVHIACADAGGVTAVSLEGEGERSWVRRRAVVAALDLLRRTALGLPATPAVE